MTLTQGFMAFLRVSCVFGCFKWSKNCTKNSKLFQWRSRSNFVQSSRECILSSCSNAIGWVCGVFAFMRRFLFVKDPKTAKFTCRWRIVSISVQCVLELAEWWERMPGRPGYCRVWCLVALEAVQVVFCGSREGLCIACFSAKFLLFGLKLGMQLRLDVPMMGNAFAADLLWVLLLLFLCD